MEYRYVWVTTMACIFSHDCSGATELRLLAVGGIHVFEGQTPCNLVRVEPADAVKDLNWVDMLALEAKSEGTAEVVCGNEKFRLESALPTRLDIEVVSDGNPAEMPVLERFKVQARLYDRRGRELEVGKFTQFEWVSSDVLEVANDRSSGEFGFCDTCFGMQGFRRVKPGEGSIEARLGTLGGTLTIGP